MSMPLAEALEQVELEPGNTYRCRVKGRWVEVRVLEAGSPRLAKPFAEADVFLDPWVELPSPPATGRCRARSGGQMHFDIPSLPDECAS
jgi:hypothetical protein